MTYEESVRYEADRRAKLMAQDMAKDMAKDMARDMANTIVYAIFALRYGKDIATIEKQYGQEAISSEPFQQVYRLMHPNGDGSDMSQMHLH